MYQCQYLKYISLYQCPLLQLAGINQTVNTSESRRLDQRLVSGRDECRGRAPVRSTWSPQELCMDGTDNHAHSTADSNVHIVRSEVTQVSRDTQRRRSNY
jgi:hypothetical protein